MTDEIASSARRWIGYAVTRCLEIISEASRRLPAELKALQRLHGGASPELATSIVTIMRMWTSNKYGMQIDLPPLRAVIQRELLGSEEG